MRCCFRFLCSGLICRCRQLLKILHAGRSRFDSRSAQRCRQGKYRLSKRLFCAFGLRVWLIEEAKCNNLKAKNAQKARLIDELCTLFIPTGANIASQKQQVLSLYKKLSPTVAMWESGMKDTVLMAIQQLLNTAAQTSFVGTAPEQSQNEPIF